MAYSDRELLARLIECEAGGEGENGMKAVVIKKRAKEFFYRRYQGFNTLIIKI